MIRLTIEHLGMNDSQTLDFTHDFGDDKPTTEQVVNALGAIAGQVAVSWNRTNAEVETSIRAGEHREKRSIAADDPVLDLAVSFWNWEEMTVGSDITADEHRTFSTGKEGSITIRDAIRAGRKLLAGEEGPL